MSSLGWFCEDVVFGHLQKIGNFIAWPMSMFSGTTVGLTASTDW